jgi:hypothetical protein
VSRCHDPGRWQAAPARSRTRRPTDDEIPFGPEWRWYVHNGEEVKAAAMLAFAVLVGIFVHFIAPLLAD